MKRNCRRTDKERQQHERAVAIRKMTDEQLCKYIDDIITTADAPIFPDIDITAIIQGFINKLETVDTPGERLSRQTPKIISAANELSHYCYSRYNPDGKCKCPFWEKYPYGHCVLHVPACWPISRIKENCTQRGGNRN